MSTTFTAIYETGVLRPLLPLLLPEHATVEVRIVSRFVRVENEVADRQRVIEALQDAGLIKPQPALESVGPVSTAEIAAAATALALGGSLSELIIAERAESY